MRCPAYPEVREGSRLALIGCALVAASLAVPGIAQADGPGQVALGAGMTMMPGYEGSRDYKARPFPIVNAQSGRFFAHTGDGFYDSTGDGVGLNLVQTQNLTMGIGANIMWGYDQNDVPHGVGGLPDALGANAFVSTRLSDYVLRLSATRAVTHQDRGVLVNARLSYPYAATHSLTLTPSVATSWANQKYMNSYFGVSADVAGNSGLSAYTPSSGIKDVSLRVAAKYAVTDRLSLTGSVGTSRIVGDAADSPLVQQKTQMRSSIGGSYAF
ncbi:MipA/OmpV family protein [Castellaniella sp.]|uniref:MipA/OmpV family protein n=1 Tax=Castellaniella sp. TaxID=1955812 RepID=UPI0025B99EA8|nr:MipA/OmpV family protein [Castellaniella sp.]